MFSVTLGQHINLVPGIHNLAIGRGNGYQCSRRGLAGGQEVREAARRLENLSRAEREILANQSSKLLRGVLGISQEDLKTLDWDQTFKVSAELLQGGKVRLSPDRKTLWLSETFLQPASPLLMTARGFKTRQANKTSGSDTAGSEEGTDGTRRGEMSFKEVLKQLNISASEKEKVKIALAAATAAAGKKNSADAEEKETESGKSKMANLWYWVRNLAGVATIVAVLLFMYQMSGMRIGQGPNEIVAEDIDVAFDDVCGCDEAKKELSDVVEFLMNPDKFSALGGKLPKGVLLVGPPGTGKTLLARAVAGQAGVPFFHSSGSEFDEVLVGQGARRVRDLFKAAKAKAPCVIFIDEIDSVGGKRTSSTLHPYANQTINQLLSEMDGFISNEGVIVLGATNRSEDLDKALLRPGRFDTKVQVSNPDVKGRKEILQLYLNKIKHDNSVNVETLAARTTGFSGADLENLVNIAAIKAAIEGLEAASMAEFEHAYDKIQMGVEWKSRARSKEDMEITAYHEAGHTIVNHFTKGSNPLHKVTIIAKGGSGGHTAFVPLPNSEWHQTKEQLIASMDVAMGGRAAEELIFGKDKITGGASGDLQSASNVSEYMVKKLGMSEKVGLRIYNDRENDNQSSTSKEMIDAEINQLLNESYKRSLNILITHKKELHLLAEALLKYETLDAADVKTIIEQKKPPPPKVPQSPGRVALKPSLPLTGLQGIPATASQLGSQTAEGAS